MAAFSCGKEMEPEEVLPESNTPAEQSSAVFTYSVSIDASKGADSKALTLEGNTLNATWAIGEAVTVYNETKGEALTGTLIAQSAGASTTLEGELSGSKGIAVGDELTLKFLSPNYSNQDGTLEYIAANCDYATASVSVTGVSGSDIRTGTASFVNQQAIVHFELSKPNGYEGLETKSVKLVADDQIITVTLSAKTKDVYVALPAISGKSFIIGASSYPAGDNYYYIKSSVSFESGKYYSIPVRMKEGVVVFNETELNSAISDNAPYIVLGSDITIGSSIQINGGKNITLDLCGHALNRNLTDLAVNGNVIKVFSGNTLTVKDSSGSNSGQIKGGRATDGGGIYNDGTLYLQGGTITDCLADSVTPGYGRGGAVFNHGTMVMSGGILLGGWGKDCGGVWNNGNLTISGGTITGNTSYAGGGGVVNYETASITGGTIYNNTATTRGGGIWNGGTLTLDGTTSTVSITGNTCSIDGGGVWNGGTVYMQGTVNVNGNHKNSWDSNFFCTDGKFITVTGSLGSSRIGVSHEGNAGTMTSGYAANNAVTNHFDNDFTEIANLGLTGGEAVLTLRTDGVYYVQRGWDSTNHKVTETMHFISSGNYTELKGALSAFPHVAVETYGDAWLVVKDSDVTRNRIIVAPGKTLNIIMCDGSSLTSQITVEAGQTVNIFGQLQDSGCLIGDSDDMFDSGIGAYEDADAGTINIHGGKIEAGYSTSGIGGVKNHHSGTINIYGGTVDAYGTSNSAAIGGGENSTGGTINIYGGEVSALSYEDGAGIGSGQDGAGMSINIHGGTITARSEGLGAGIGGGDNAVGGNITITGGTIKAYSGKDADMNVATGDGAGIGGGEDADGGVIIISGGVVNATSNGYGAGIGGGQDGLGGTITISGGTVYAHGGEDAAGIGCGENTGGRTEDGGSITISGGTVYAYGNHDSDSRGAGIGGGQDASGGAITITGGYVRAYGGNNAAGIGSGEETSTGPNINGGTITITGGDVSGIGKDGGAGIGAGAGASAGVISIEGGTVEGHCDSGCIGAIRSNDIEHGPNSITIGSYLRVNAGSDYFSTSDRIYWLWNAHDIHIEPCSHNGNVCSWCMYGH